MNDFDSAFQEAVSLFNQELFWEAIDIFKEMESKFENSESTDDLHINIAVTYMMLGLYEEAEEYFLPVYREELGNGEFAGGGNNFGRTRSRAILGLIRICLAKGELDEAQSYFAELNNDDASGLIENDTRILFREIAKTEIGINENKNH